MTSERYAPGHSETALDFMRIRSGAIHAGYFLPFLADARRVLDCGCGPGTITVDLAEHVPRGSVVGVDREARQFVGAELLAEERGVQNVSFQQADVYELPFGEDTFDRVYSNALFEHIADPARALVELRRVMEPGGVIGVSVPDFGGLVMGPANSGMEHVTERYRLLQSRGGGDYYRGRSLGRSLHRAGFGDIRMGARAEVLQPKLTGELFAEILEPEEPKAAATARAWALDPDAFFAQIWVEVTATAGAIASLELGDVEL